MKKLLPIVLGIVLLSACKLEPVDDTVVKFAIAETLPEIEYQLKRLEREIEDQGNIKEDKKLLENCIKLTSLKKAYLKSKNIPDLLIYSDSIQYWYARMYHEGGEISRQLVASKKLVMQEPDSVNTKNLFFWGLKAEVVIINFASQKVGEPCYFGPMFRPFKMHYNQTNYSPGDTVYATFDLGIPEENMGNLKLNFDSLFVNYAPTGTKINRTIINTPPYVTLRVIPAAKGEYQISGNVKFIHFSGRTFKRSATSFFEMN